MDSNDYVRYLYVDTCLPTLRVRVTRIGHHLFKYQIPP